MSYYFGGGLFNTSYQSSNSGLSNLLGDYASIRSGSYKKLLKAYYSDTNNTTKKPTNDKKSELYEKLTGNSASKELKTVKSDAEDLAKSASALATKGTKSLFNKKNMEVTDAETGEKTTVYDYDKDAIVKAVKQFASDYNDMLDSASESNNVSIMRRAVLMTGTTSNYSDSLKNIGIEVGSDNKLTVDADKLKEADINKVKDLFNGVNSFAHRTAQKANEIMSDTSKTEVSSLYNNNGAYSNYNYYSGGYFSGFF